LRAKLEALDDWEEVSEESDAIELL
jgi:hypothetical protein